MLGSEAAAAVCIESAETTGATVRYAKIDRFAMGGDATHLTGSDPTGSTLRRLVRCVMDGRQVDLIHAHGTGTIANDPIELAAFNDKCVVGETTAPLLPPARRSSIFPTRKSSPPLTARSAPARSASASMSHRARS